MALIKQGRINLFPAVPSNKSKILFHGPIFQGVEQVID